MPYLDALKGLSHAAQVHRQRDARLALPLENLAQLLIPA